MLSGNANPTIAYFFGFLLWHKNNDSKRARYSKYVLRAGDQIMYVVESFCEQSNITAVNT